MIGLLYLKWTRVGRIPSYQGGRPIPLNRWTKRVPHPIICERGWHACRWEDAIHHIADELWVCEVDGMVVTGNDKIAAERLRLVEQVTTINDRTLRLFACDAAESVLPAYEAKHPSDDRPRRAISVARRFAVGEATAVEMEAARSAAESAALSAAWAAESAAWSAAWAAESTARSAAELAAWSAAWSAAWAARAAESAAGSAAGSGKWAEMNDLLLTKYAALDPARFAHRDGVR